MGLIRPGQPRLAITIAALLLQSLVSLSAFGQVAREKVLHRLEFADVPGGVEATVYFNRPVRYLSHSPKDRGKIIRIELAPFALAPSANEGGRRREALQSTIGRKTPLIEVVHERATGQRPVLVVRFRQDTDFEIRPGSTGRTLGIFMRRPVPIRVPDNVEPAIVEGSARSTEILAEGRKAMTGAEYTRAASLFELVLSPHGEEKGKEAEDLANRRTAKELLGLARERNGQAAHARAEYEEYLVQYPDGEGAERVGQRLQALLSAEAQPSPALRDFSPKDDDYPVEFFGDVALGYYRGQDLTGDRDNSVYDSTLISDLDLTARGELDGYELIGDLSMSQDHDFIADGSKDTTRVILLSLEAQDPTRTLSGIAGRQTRRDGGVLGRFDGAVLRGQLDEHLLLSGVFGFPLETTTSSDINTDRVFLGTALDIEAYLDGATAQVFVIGQLDHDLVDRLALGTELNYVGSWGYARGFIDYDAYYNLLNLALISANFNFTDDTQVYGFLQTQTVPFFTLTSALQGQDVDDLDGLHDELSKSEIRDLAKDRTARSYTVTFGGSHWLNTDLQVAGDVTFITVGSTSNSDVGVFAPQGVLASDGTDGDVSTSIQVTKNSLMFSGDISSASFRFFDGEDSDGYRFYLRSRIPLRRGLYLDPRMLLDYRDRRDGGNDLLTIRPTTQLTWDWRQFTFELEGGFEVLEYFGSQNPDAELSYLLEVLVRYEF